MAGLNIKRYDRRTVFFAQVCPVILTHSQTKTTNRHPQRASAYGHWRGYNNARPVIHGPGTRDFVNSLSLEKTASAFLVDRWNIRTDRPFHDYRTREKCLSSIVLHGNGKLRPWRTTWGKIKKTVQENFVSGSNEKIAPLLSGRRPFALRAMIINNTLLELSQVLGSINIGCDKPVGSSGFF